MDIGIIIPAHNEEKRIAKTLEEYGSFFDDLRENSIEIQEQNKTLSASLQKFDNVKELHIHIDLLKNSDHGVDILRQKMGKLQMKYMKIYERYVNNSGFI